MPTREDPFGDYDHLIPVPLEQAAKELQIAAAKCDHMQTAINLQRKTLGEMDLKMAAARQEHAEKSHLMTISAMAHYVPPK